jgi:hypothetical protein
MLKFKNNSRAYPFMSTNAESICKEVLLGYKNMRYFDCFSSLGISIKPMLPASAFRHLCPVPEHPAPDYSVTGLVPASAL